ncbi:hypothetical protein CVIRNUC_006002 [Coccomyxa viridis]|uniref:Uncharacterized protein n=1 Tax=Coccomyxa viridis TaxID=1274662 RepID=A0AAV1I6Y0_9CHLO|nr:hypothetical protein CVIRNUC_006002 [Coccomyxa viridis]
MARWRFISACCVVTAPSLCLGNIFQDAVQDVRSWAKHELAVLAHLSVPRSGGHGPLCLNAEGRHVDWWVAIKPPGSSDLLYLDSQQAEADLTKWRFRPLSIDRDPVQKTLQQLSSNTGQYGHVMYSDEPPPTDGIPVPDDPDAVLTQGKGALGLGSSQGFWITHSLPSFPLLPGSSQSQSQEFPRRAQPYAHSLLCVSAAAEQLRSLAGTLRANSYNIYSSALPRDTGTWSAESLAAAYEMLLDEPEGGAAEADVVMNEITSIEGERFVVLGKNGSRSGVDGVDGILGSFFGAPMLKTSQFCPEPHAGSASGFPTLRARELRAPGSGVAWNASVERSHWQISLREGLAPLACQDDLLRPDHESSDTTHLPSQPPWNTGSALPLQADRQTPSSVEQPALFAGGPSANGVHTAAEQPLWSRTMINPFVSASRRLLTRKDYWQTTTESPGRTLSEFITHGTEDFRRPLRALAAQLAHRLLGSRHMTASLSMRRSMLSMDGKPQPSRKVLTWLRESMGSLMAVLGVDQPTGAKQALYQPQDDSYASAAADIMRSRDPASASEDAIDVAGTRLLMQQGIEEGLEMELRLTGASSVLPEQAQQLPEGAGRMGDMSIVEENCLGRVSVLEQLKCRARSLQQEADSVRGEIDRLEVAAAAESAQEYMQSYVIASTPSTAWMYGEASDMDTTEDGKESEVAAAEQSSCGRAEDGGELPEEKHAVCFKDRGRSLAVNGLPGGAVCFAGNVGLWHAFRTLVQQYEYCL